MSSPSLIVRTVSFSGRKATPKKRKKNTKQRCVLELRRCDDDGDDDVELNVLGCRVDTSGTNCD